MLGKLSFEDFKNLAKRSDKVLVYERLAGDLITPISAIRIVEDRYDNVAFLESAELDQKVGKMSCIGIDPILTFYAFKESCYLERDGSVEKIEEDPIEACKKFIDSHLYKTNQKLDGFLGGGAGFLSYDGIRYFEKVEDSHMQNQKIPDLFYQVFRKYVSFDHKHKIVTLAVSVDVTKDLKKDFEKAKKTLEELKALLFHPSFPKKDERCLDKLSKKSLQTKNELTDKEFVSIAEKAKDYIEEGDAFQIVLSRTIEAEMHCSAFDFYRALKFVSPSPYMFFIKRPDFTILGASPEKLLSIEDGKLETIPIAGTRARKSLEEDDEIMKDLLTDEKENAEHMMLVDLSRNDLGRISEIGSVKVRAIKKVQILSHVMHLISIVEGRLKKGVHPLDALGKVFPAGTLSGAPKIRAMEIIDELEPSKRGVYGGAIFYLDPDLNMDSCIAIRMAQILGNKALIRTGAGIVHDSVPKLEADETHQKARGLLAALKLAMEGSL
uniref:Anthranilate synthase component 1 n=1 Tax=Aerophobetes bacterium TaxID=2030807 RepID=A0A2A4YKL2_UNCAE